MKKNPRRVLARHLATELTAEDLRAVAAGTSAITMRAPDYKAEADTIADPPDY